MSFTQEQIDFVAESIQKKRILVAPFTIQCAFIDYCHLCPLNSDGCKAKKILNKHFEELLV